MIWQNEDGTELEKDENVAYGATPEYNGETPTKDADAEFSYTFKAWTPEIKAVDGNITYTATYDKVGQTYTVIWQNEDGTELEKDENVAYGATPEYNGETPTKDADAEFSYTFKEWSPEIQAVDGNITYTATYDKVGQTYTVIWQNEDGTELEKDENVAYGATPEYNRETPTKDADAEFSYTFQGWEPALKPVDGNITYKATFTATAVGPTQLTGVLNIFGNPAPGQTLTAFVMGANTDQLVYQWFVGDRPAGVGQTFTIPRDAAGQIITCVVTSPVMGGQLMVGVKITGDAFVVPQTGDHTPLALLWPMALLSAAFLLGNRKRKAS